MNPLSCLLRAWMWVRLTRAVHCSPVPNPGGHYQYNSINKNASGGYCVCFAFLFHVFSKHEDTAVLVLVIRFKFICRVSAQNAETERNYRMCTTPSAHESHPHPSKVLLRDYKCWGLFHIFCHPVILISCKVVYFNNQLTVQRMNFQKIAAVWLWESMKPKLTYLKIILLAVKFVWAF